jgi:hypothetical protein
MPVFAGGGGGGAGADLSYVAPARAASTANIPSLSTLLTIDGVVLIAGDRVLVKDQTLGEDNGVYVAAVGAWTRATDFDDSSEVVASSVVPVEEGTANADTSWLLATNNPITVGTTSLLFVLFGTTTPLADAAPVNVDTAAPVVGVSSDAAREDHKHDVATGLPVSIDVGDAQAEGVALSLARSDHQHAVTPPNSVTAVDAAAGVVGVATVPAVEDHKHQATVAAPTGLSAGGANVEGVATSLARSDHEHAMAAATPSDVVDSVAVEGVAATFSRGDHQHAHGNRSGGTLHASAWGGVAAGFLPKSEPNGGVPTVGDDSSAGFALGSMWYDAINDDVYVCTDASVGAAVWAPVSNSGLLGSAAPIIVDKSAASAGVSGLGSRQDHKHDIDTSAAVGLDANTANAEGVDTKIARSDHTHEISEAGAVTAAAIGDAGGAGVALGFARKDHEHAVAAAGGASLSIINAGDAAAEGVAATFPRGDHQHAVATAAAVNVDGDTTNTEGVSTSLARADHTHAIPTAIVEQVTDIAAGATKAIGTANDLIRADHAHGAATAAPVEITDSTNAAGSALSFVHSDHQHSHGNRGGGALHAAATGAVAGFMSAADKTALDAHLIDTSNPHSTTITEAYDAGGGTCTLNATDAAFRIQGSGLATGRRGYFEVFRSAIEIFNVDYDTTVARSLVTFEGAGGLEFEAGTNNPMFRLNTNQLIVLPENVTFTGGTDVVLTDSTILLDFVNATLGTYLNFKPTLEFGQAPAAAEMLRAISVSHTAINTDTEANNFTIARHIVSDADYVASNAALTFGTLIEFYANTTLRGTGTGTLTGPANIWAQFYAEGIIGAGATIDGDRVAFYADDPTITGTLSGLNTGLLITNLTAGTAGAYGIQSLMTAGATKRFISHTGTAQSDFGGEVHIAQYLRHLGDTDTYLSFETDTVKVFAGNLETLRIVNTSLQVNPTGGIGLYKLIVVGNGGNVLDCGVTGAGANVLGFFGSTPAQQPAAYTVTNPVTRRSYDTTTVTLQQLAEVVGTIIGDQQAYGLFA